MSVDSISNHFGGGGASIYGVAIKVGSETLDIHYANFAYLPSQPTVATSYERVQYFTNAKGVKMATFFFKSGTSSSTPTGNEPGDPNDDKGVSGSTSTGSGYTFDAMSLTVPASHEALFKKAFGN